MTGRNNWMRASVVATFLLLSVLAGLAQEKTALPAKTSETPAMAPSERAKISSHKKPAPVENEQPSDGRRENLQVHGQWTIVVRNADGSIASRHEFENSLQNATILNELLAHQATNPIWWVYLKFSGMNHIWILTPDQGGTPTLAVYVPTSGVNTNKLVLTGTVPGTSASGGVGYFLSGQLIYVGTQLNVTCAPNATCDSIQAGFTSRDLTVAVPPDTAPPPAITVQSGQGIDVTVVLSFQ